MPSSVSQRLDEVPRKTLKCGGESLLKKIESNDDARRQVGRLIARAIEVAGISNKDASLRMGLSADGVQVSRWCAGTEPPSLLRLMSVPVLCCGLAVALAELQDGAEVRTVITLKRLA